MTTPTDSIRGALVELDQRGIPVAHAEINLSVVDDRAEFVRIARAFGANILDHGATFVWAKRQNGIATITVFSGAWWDAVAPTDRDQALNDLRRDVLAVVADDVAVPA